MAKEIPEHRDALGRLLKVGDCVAYPSNNMLVIGVIKKFNPIMIKVAGIGKDTWSRREKNKYPSECVLLDGPEVTMYIIKNTGK